MRFQKGNKYGVVSVVKNFGGGRERLHRVVYRGLRALYRDNLVGLTSSAPVAIQINFGVEPKQEKAVPQDKDGESTVV